MNAKQLHAKVMAGEMVERHANGRSYAVWKQGEEFVMSQQYGKANPRHELLVASTDAERLAAHWDGFCGVPAGTTELEAKTFAQAVTAAKRLAREVWEEQVRHYSGQHVAYREAEIIASDGQERSVDEPDYLPFSKLTGKYLKEAIRAFLERAPGTTTVYISGGFDLYESFGEYMTRNADYEPRIENFDYSVPKALIEQVRVELTGEALDAIVKGEY